MTKLNPVEFLALVKSCAEARENSWYQTAAGYIKYALTFEDAATIIKVPNEWVSIIAAAARVYGYAGFESIKIEEGCGQ